jgi:hypothetical protein
MTKPWYDKVVEHNKSFYDDIKIKLEKYRKADCYDMTGCDLVETMSTCLKQALYHGSRNLVGDTGVSPDLVDKCLGYVREPSQMKTIYVVSELPSMNIVDYLDTVIKIPNDALLYNYPSAMILASKIEWYGIGSYDGIRIEFVQSMNDGLMKKYRKDICRRTYPWDSFIVDMATVNETFFYETLVPLIDTGAQFQFVLRSDLR